MRYLTCTNCAVDKAKCPRRAQIREAVAGCGFNSAKFTCKDRKAMFRPGQRVQVRWRVYEEYGTVHSVLFFGTVMDETLPKFIVRIDPDQEFKGYKPSDAFRNANLIVKVRPADMAAMNVPDINLCKDCGGLPQWGTCLANGGDPADECGMKYLAGIDLSFA